MAGPKNDDRQVARMVTATIASMEPFVATSHASTSIRAPRPRSVMSSTSRRSNRSATMPAGMDRKT